MNNRSRETFDALFSEINGYPAIEIEEKGFEHFYNLVSITILDTIKRIGHNAFYNRFNLESIIIGAGVESIGNNAFKSCSKLTTIHYNGISTQWDAVSKGTDWNMRIKATKVICKDGDKNLN